MLGQLNVLWPFQSYLNALKTFTYSPKTNWDDLFSGWFTFKPTVHFGSNIRDVGVEDHVLGKVGSYGKQISLISHALNVVLKGIDRTSLTPQERRYVEDFETLARDADAAVADYKGRRPDRGITHSGVDHMVDQLLQLRQTQPELFEDLSNRIVSRLEMAKVRRPPLYTVEP